MTSNTTYFVYAFPLLAAIAKEVKHGGFNTNEKFSMYILLYIYIYIYIYIVYWSVSGYRCANIEVHNEGARMMFKQHRDVKG